MGTREATTKVEAHIDVALLDRPVEMTDLARPAPAGCGGESVFLGRTRAETHPDCGDLVSLDYDAYREMAERVIRNVCEAAAAEFGASAVVVRHTVGRVAVGDASVGVAVWAGHREQSFGACRRVIDWLKAEAPIWKREVYAMGDAWQAGTPVASERAAP